MEIASRLNGLIEVNKLTELGKLEQDLVYGDATSKEVINFLSLNQTLPAADKVRLQDGSWPVRAEGRAQAC